MRHAILWLFAVVATTVLPGCTWETAKRSLLGSIYGAYGEGYTADRLSDFDHRYEQQTRAAEEYYQQQR
jgi:hypothetical protein